MSSLNSKWKVLLYYLARGKKGVLEWEIASYVTLVCYLWSAVRVRWRLRSQLATREQRLVLLGKETGTDEWCVRPMRPEDWAGVSRDKNSHSNKTGEPLHNVVNNILGWKNKQLYILIYNPSGICIFKTFRFQKSKWLLRVGSTSEPWERMLCLNRWGYWRWLVPGKATEKISFCFFTPQMHLKGLLCLTNQIPRGSWVEFTNQQQHWLVTVDKWSSGSQ